MSEELIVYTPAFFPDTNPVTRLLHSCRSMNVTLVAYGVGQQYQPHGVYSHIEKFAEILMTGDSQIAMLTDAFDSWLVADANEIVAKFHEFDADVVVAGERDCWPCGSLRERFPDTRSPYRWLNAGGMIGYRCALIDACERLVRAYGDGASGEMQSNPQGMWSQGFVEGVVRGVSIDHWCGIFQTMSGGASGDLSVVPNVNGEPRRLRNAMTDSRPCVVHHNGRCGDDAAVERSYRSSWPEGETVREELRR